jgi:hypothetical protein
MKWPDPIHSSDRTVTCIILLAFAADILCIVIALGVIIWTVSG